MNVGRAAAEAVSLFSGGFRRSGRSAGVIAVELAVGAPEASGSAEERVMVELPHWLLPLRMRRRRQRNEQVDGPVL